MEEVWIRVLVVRKRRRSIHPATAKFTGRSTFSVSDVKPI